MPNRSIQPDPAGFRFDKIARFYDALNSIVEGFSSRRRREVLSRARGDILEVGVGTGCSFKDYPPGQHIVAVDISPEMLSRAEEKRKDYSGRIELRKEDIQSLSFKDESFDTIFCSWAFCSVTDPVRGLNQLHRILKKDGQLLMLEHVRSKNRVLGYLMDRLNPLIARVGIDNINRDTVQHVRRAGFKIEQERNLVYDVAKAIAASK
jgi:ubiquinone/menaquinone biosynthesis C-methylase UbiE